LIGAVWSILPLLMLLPSCEPLSFCWSPNSDQIALVWHEKTDSRDYFFLGITNISKQDMLHVQPPIALDAADQEGFLSPPVWSPNGKYIAYYKVKPFIQQLQKNSESKSNAIWQKDALGYVPPSGRVGFDGILTLGINTGGYDKDGTRLGWQTYDGNKVWLDMKKELAQRDVKSLRGRFAYDTALVIVSPDSKQQRVLKKLRWAGDVGFGEKSIYPYLKPAWSADSNRVFYTRMLSKDRYYIESVNLNGQDKRSHMSSSTGCIHASVKGHWIGTIWKESVVLSRIDGTARKQFDLEDINETSTSPVVLHGQQT